MAGNKKKAPDTPDPAGASFQLSGYADLYDQGTALGEHSSLQVKHAFSGRARRGEQPEKVSVSPDDVIEVEFDDGPRVWMSGAEFMERCPGSTRAAAAGGTPVPDGLEISGAATARGPVKWMIKGLKVIGVDLEDELAIRIAEKVERGDGSRRRPGPGLYRCSLDHDDFGLSDFSDATTPSESGSEWLVFIHGTASSTWGSFGELWNADRADALEALRRRYGDRVLGFEHRTLSRNPIDNATELVERLPPGATVHLVTHSRGGMVAELLCRGSRADGRDPFSSDEFALLEKVVRKFATKEEEGAYREAMQGARRSLEALNEKLKAKDRPVVARCVRVAAPVLGTTLASRRLDRWLSVVGSVASRALPGSPLGSTFRDLGEFVAAVVSQRTDPATLPGLEAMLPDSALVKVINWPDVEIGGDLLAIAGDIAPDAWWAKLLVWLTDRFYAGDHDLVVNTPSMYGGAGRSGAAVKSFHQGSRVNHFTYFENADSVDALIRGLTADRRQLEEAFSPLKKPTTPIAREAIRRPAGERPVVFVLPGIMGSELAVGDDRVWLQIRDLMFGGLKKLSIGADQVHAVRPLDRFYGDIIAHLGRSHDVVPFPFDWRLPVEDEARRLNERVVEVLDTTERSGMPLRFLAHSMGGLVARTMIAQHGDTWRRITEREGARLVMMGTPNGGSHAITELLTGRSRTLRYLVLLDLAHDREGLLGIVSRYPGVLAMLPTGSRDDFFAHETWQDYHAAATDGWRPPEPGDLERARRFRRMLDAAPIDSGRMVYVAGRAELTVAEMVLSEERRRIEFLATARGDGTVTWSSGILSGVPTWYMNAEHGDLPATREAFPAIEELLVKGTTDRLSRTPPVAREAEVGLVTLPDIDADTLDPDDLFPDADTLAAAALGARGAERKVSAGEPALAVRVCHGNLDYARYPVAIGHYTGDTIISAERALDSALAGALSRRNDLGLYPGPAGSHEVVVNHRLTVDPEALPKGAIVIGFGDVGELSASALAKSVSSALVAYALRWSERFPERRLADGRFELGVTSLLIGTGAGGIRVVDSLYALLHGVRSANRRLAEIEDGRLAIVDLELIELWEDRAIEAASALRRLQDEPALRGAFTFRGEVVAGEGGKRRVAFEEPGGWWDRLAVRAERDREGREVLTYRAATRRAGAAVQQLVTQRRLVDLFVERSIRTTRDDRSIGKTLFELLLPNELKEQAPNQDNLIMLLDEDAARYPWELLDDPSGSAERPYACEHGLLRQLEYAGRSVPRKDPTRIHALVVGDPPSNMVELKGAQEEATIVRDELLAGGLDTTLLLRESGEHVIRELFARPYRVLHLAAHGVYEMPVDERHCRRCGQVLIEREPGQTVTGMVLGDGLVLTPHEVAQLRRTPELVFINCCHLGRIEDDHDERDANERNDYNLIAANIATQFIRDGVRAVVAAGWAVDDGAARTFAAEFYRQMISGLPFGDAVKHARHAAHDRHPGTNTWGAYQCYGDPDYRLVRRSGEQPRSGWKPRWASPAEALADIENLSSDLGNLADDEVRRSSELEQLRMLVDAAEEKGWLTQGRICAAIGRAFAEALEFGDAIRHYRAAWGCEDGSASIESLEQLANIIARRAADTSRDPAEILDAIELLETLQGQAASRRDTAMAQKDRSGEAAQPERRSEDDSEPRSVATAERYSLLGSAYKRLALVDEQRRGDALAKMYEYYGKGVHAAVRSNSDTLYAELNALSGELCLAWQSKKRLATDFRERVKRAQSSATAAYAKSRNFWKEVAKVDAELLAVLIDSRPAAADIERVADRYLEARKRGSARKFRSVLDQIDFFMTMASGVRLRRLGELRSTLEASGEEAGAGN